MTGALLVPVSLTEYFRHSKRCSFRARVSSLAFMLMLLPGVARTTRAASSTAYERDIKPILQQRCYSCHSRLKQKSELRLDAGALIGKGGKHGSAIVAGRSAESPLLQRVLSTVEDERMPPEGKPLTPDQIALLRRWIDDGARYPKDEVIPQTAAEHWAFQPVRQPPVPTVKNKRWPRNAIDRFVLAKLEQRGWKPAPVAGPRALLRRVHLDLTGLPPTLAEQESFLQAPSADALDQVIDGLLSRPAYGERWARHWLDVVRYADSNGYERDAEKPFVWRYRDYVINALNGDKPFDRFILEQLAGDELPGACAETMIATGFQRLGHWDDEPADPETDRYDQLDDIVSTTAQAFLGLTLGCARCHDHKFEPLSTRDYYSMVAVFNPLRRPQKGRTELALPVGSREELAVLAGRDGEIGRLQQQTNTLTAAEIEKRIQKLRDATPDLPQAYILQEPATNPPVTHVLLRGSPGRPGEVVAPAVPSVLVNKQPEFQPSGERTSGRRLGLASWMASPDNSLTARVIVNRVWQQHFGYGLVRTPNDFGLMGEPATHPELLDWLAHWFVNEAHWSLKKLHRLILASNTWRMSKAPNPEYAAADPEDRLLWRMPYRRLEVEAIRDSMLAVSGQLNTKGFGPSMKPRIQQAALEANTDKESIWKPSDDLEASRRTIYAFIKRGLVVPMLEVLDLGDTVSSCPKRQVTTVAPQALSLFNGEFVNQQTRHFAARLLIEAGSDHRKQIDLAWRLALGRPPAKDEAATMLEFREQEAGRLLAEAAKENRSLSNTEAQRAALEQMCRVIYNLNEFVYPE
ncbi:MAG: PSD1 and planctomycete cytochrome C domain-containing protein [Verrucomicrobiota bacterium]